MKKITLPQKTRYTETGKNEGEIVIEKCYPGYGTTVGNALRRVLLSSLDGTAVSAVRIKGVNHEFSAIEGIKEDVVQIILNLKKVRFQSFSDEPIKLSLKHKGKGKITAGKIKNITDVKIINKDDIIATATSAKTNIDMEIEVSRGIGYVPVEQQKRDDEVGTVGIDAIYTPIKSVNYRVENMRVGKRTDYDRIVLNVSTDGSITPEEAFEKAIKILVGQFENLLKESDGEDERIKKGKAVAIAKEEKKEKDEKKAKASFKKEVEEKETEVKNLKISELKGISTRTINALEANKLAIVDDVIELTKEELTAMDGMGEKSVKEIRKSIGTLGLVLKG